MTDHKQIIWEDDEYVYLPRSIIDHLPDEYRGAFEARLRQGEEMHSEIESEIRSLIRLANTIPTTASLRYIFSRLRNAKMPVTTDAFMEHEMLTTAFIVTYGRLFASGSEATGVARKKLPSHLRSAHDEIIDARNNRYAHTASHESVKSGIEMKFDDQDGSVELHLSMGMYVGGRNEWEELVIFLDGLMHDRLQKILKRLNEKTGLKWTFPDGPPPLWVGS